MQRAIDIGYDKAQGTLQIEELRQALAEGWQVVFTESSSGGDILVIIEKDNNAL